MADDGAPTKGSRVNRSDSNEQLLDSLFLYGGNAAYIEQLQTDYDRDPNSVPVQWREFFAGLGDTGEPVAKQSGGPSWRHAGWPLTQRDENTDAIDYQFGDEDEVYLTREISRRAPQASSRDISQAVQESIRAIMMIRAYRIRGHLAAELDPLRLNDRGEQPELDPESYGLTPDMWDRPIFIDYVLGMEYASVRQMLDVLKRTYCSSVGIEFMHISDPQEKSWLQERIEGPDKGVAFTNEGKIAILKKLIETEAFEQFLHKRYPGTKRFGLDGGESAVPALEQIIKRGGALGVEEIVLGMPHRGRLNVLAAVMGKPYKVIFHEFQGGSSQGADEFGSGDVKYHLGASSDRAFDDNNVHLSLTANPSHLEAVNPVVLGKARAKQGFLKRGSHHLRARQFSPH